LILSEGKVFSKVATVPVFLGLVRVWVGFGSEFRKTFGYGLVLVFATIFQFGSALFQQNQKTIFQKFCSFFLKFFFSNFLKNMKIQYKNTFNQTKIRISQNLMFKNNINIIFGHFVNILYCTLKYLSVWFGLGLGCVEKSQFSLF
jgi:hypothetical protein